MNPLLLATKIALKIALMLVLLTPTVFAQTTESQVSISTTDIDLDSAETITDLSDKRMAIELRAGMGFGNVTHYQGSNLNTAASGANFALTADLPVGVSSSFNTGVNFVQKGTSDGSNTTRVNYLVLPFQMKAHFGHPRAFRWNVGLGPYVGIRTSAYVTHGGQPAGNVAAASATDFGGRASLGFEFPIQARYAVLAGADYDVGITQIVDNVRTRTLLVSLGLSYEI